MAFNYAPGPPQKETGQARLQGQSRPSAGRDKGGGRYLLRSNAEASFRGDAPEDFHVVVSRQPNRKRLTLAQRLMGTQMDI